MKAEEYRTECLENRLLPFIQQYHNIDDVLFWPDLASIHYEKSVQNWLNTNHIKFVQKTENPPNVPQARPIERFWHLCKLSYKKRSVIPKNVSQFKEVWTNISKTVAQTSAQTLMRTVRKTLKLIGDKGVLAPFKLND